MKTGTIARTWAALFLIGFVAGHLQGQGRMKISMSDPVFYRTVKVDGLSIFCREAGPKDAPTILLLHGLPSSSRMFEPLFTRLSDRYHLVAPDYPGFGHSDWPDPKQFPTRSTIWRKSSMASPQRPASRAARFTCRIMACRSGSAGRLRIRIASRPSLSRTGWHIHPRGIRFNARRLAPVGLTG